MKRTFNLAALIERGMTARPTSLTCHARTPSARFIRQRQTIRRSIDRAAGRARWRPLALSDSIQFRRLIILAFRERQRQTVDTGLKARKARVRLRLKAGKGPVRLRLQISEHLPIGRFD